MSTADSPEQMMRDILGTLLNALDPNLFRGEGIGLLLGLLMLVLAMAGIRGMLQNKSPNELMAEGFEILIVGGLAYWAISSPELLNSIHKGFLAVTIAATQAGGSSGAVGLPDVNDPTAINGVFFEAMAALAQAAMSLWDSPVHSGQSAESSGGGFFSWLNIKNVVIEAAEGLAVMFFKLFTALLMLGVVLAFCAAFVATQVFFLIAAVVAPLMIPFYVFRPLSFIAEGWFRFTVASGMQMIVGGVLLGITSGLVRKVGELSTGLNAEHGAQFGLFAVLFLLTGIMGYLMMQALDVGAGLAAGMARAQTPMPNSMSPAGLAERGGATAEQVAKVGGQGVVVTAAHGGGMLGGAIGGAVSAWKGQDRGPGPSLAQVREQAAVTRERLLNSPAPRSGPMSIGDGAALMAAPEKNVSYRSPPAQSAKPAYNSQVKATPMPSLPRTPVAEGVSAALGKPANPTATHGASTLKPAQNEARPRYAYKPSERTGPQNTNPSLIAGAAKGAWTGLKTGGVIKGYQAARGAPVGSATPAGSGTSESVAGATTDRAGVTTGAADGVVPTTAENAANVAKGLGRVLGGAGRGAVVGGVKGVLAAHKTRDPLSGALHGWKAAGPKEEKPSGKTDQPQQPRTDKPQQPRTDKPQQPRTDKPQQPRTDKPQQPRTDKPQQPRTDKPQQPRTDKPQQAPTQSAPKQNAPQQAPSGQKDAAADKPAPSKAPRGPTTK